MFDEGFLFESGHSICQLVLECCYFHLEQDTYWYLLAPLERFQQSVSFFRVNLISYGRIGDSTIVACLLKLVQSGGFRGKIITCVPFLRVDVVVGRACLEDVYEGASTVLDGGSQGHFQVSYIKRVTSRDECVSRRNGHGDWVDALNNGGGRHGLCFQALWECGRGLSLGQAVYTIIMEYVCEVEIPSARIDEVASAYSKAVTISANGDDCQARVGQLGSRRDGEDSTVQCVEAVGVYEMWSLTRASDA